MALGNAFRGMWLGAALLAIGACAGEPPGECKRFDACCKELTANPALLKLGKLADTCAGSSQATTMDVCSKGLSNVMRDLKLAGDADRSIKPPDACMR